jgi:hypothetical protein
MNSASYLRESEKDRPSLPFLPNEHFSSAPSNITKRNLFLLPRRLLNRRLQRRRVRTHDLTDLLAVLEDQEGGHGANAELLRDIGDFVDVELDEVHVGVFV